jgi:hypothetical protein
MAKSITCKADVGGKSKDLSIAEALAGIGGNYRCLECDESVETHRKGKNGQAAHFEHLKRNSKCSLSDKR